MDTNTPSQFISILDQLTTKYRKIFRVRITSIWHAENDFEDLPSRRAIAQSLTAIADSARALISEAAIQLSAVPKTPEIHVIFSGLIWKYIAEIRGDLVSASSVASRLDTSTSFDDVKFGVINQQIERQIVSYHDAFNDSAKSRKKLAVKQPEFGRLPVWDWIGAKQYIREQFPEGVPQVRGMRTRVAEMMAEWFQLKFKREPHMSQCFTHAAEFFT